MYFLSYNSVGYFHFPCRFHILTCARSVCKLFLNGIRKAADTSILKIDSVPGYVELCEVIRFSRSQKRAAPDCVILLLMGNYVYVFMYVCICYRELSIFLIDMELWNTFLLIERRWYTLILCCFSFADCLNLHILKCSLSLYSFKMFEHHFQLHIRK